jgi:hypothetical protein
MRRDGRVLVVEFRGLLLADDARKVKGHLVAALTWRPDVVLADYSRAVLALTADQINELMSDGGPNALPHLPAVVIPALGAGRAMQVAAVAAARDAARWRAVAPDQARGLDAAHWLLRISRPGPAGNPPR